MRMGAATSVFATESPLHLVRIFLEVAVQTRPETHLRAAALSTRSRRKVPPAPECPVVHAPRDRWQRQPPARRPESITAPRFLPSSNRPSPADRGRRVYEYWSAIPDIPGTAPSPPPVAGGARCPLRRKKFACQHPWIG